MQKRILDRMIWAGVMIAAACCGASTVRAQDAKAPAEQDSGVYQVPAEELGQHEMRGYGVIREKPSDKAPGFQTVTLKIVVDVEGNVVSATAIEGPSESYAAAVAAAMKWKYVPFERDGVPTKASLEDYVRILPLEELPKTHEEFPNINNASGVVMRLSRSGCLGRCPSYEIEIYGDGRIEYTGKGFVVVEGKHHDQLTADEVSQLIEAFRKADYFSLKDEYKYSVTDGPTFETSFDVDNLRKSVSDYFGDEAGMPQAVTDLERTLDAVGKTRKWIAGTGETVASLKREGFDFKSAEAAKILARATGGGSTELVRDLLKEGVGLSGKNKEGSSALELAVRNADQGTIEMLIKAGAGKDDPEMKTRALGEAAKAGNLTLVKLLVNYGGDPKGEAAGENGKTTVLMWAAFSGMPEVVETILAARPDLNARDDKGWTALEYLTESNAYFDKQRHADRAAVAHILAKAGLNLNAQDSEGNTALHRVFDDEIARALIEEGANVDIRNADGETPLMTAYSVGKLKLLVAAGADIHARDHKGLTALDHALEIEDAENVNYLRSLKIEETPAKPEPAATESAGDEEPE